MTDLDKILEKHNNHPPTLYQIIHDELGYSHDCTAEIIDARAVLDVADELEGK